MYWPLSRTNNFQGLLYSRGWHRGVAALPVSDFEVMLEAIWDGPVICHFHWLSGIDSETALKRFESTLRQLKNQGKSILWTAHNVLPHGVTDADLALRARRAMVEAADLIHILNPRTPEIVAPYYALAHKPTFHSPHPAYTGDQPDTVTREEARFELGLSATTTVFLCFGAIQPYKGIDDLLAAAQKLKRDHPGLDWALVIAGDATDKNLARGAQAAIEALGGQLLFLPTKLSTNDIQYLFRAADFCVLPYRAALNSGAAMLSLTFGIPIVAPESHAFTELLARGAGIGYPANDIGALAGAMAAAVATGPRGMQDRARAVAMERSPSIASDAFFSGLWNGLQRAHASAPGSETPASSDAPARQSRAPVMPRRFNIPGQTGQPPRPPKPADGPAAAATKDAMTWQAQWVSQLAGFAEARHVLEIGAGSFATTMSLARHFPTKRFFGLDQTLSAIALSNLADIPPNVSVLKHDARHLDFVSRNYFEFSFSIAVMEHIRELADHLGQMQRIIAPGGYYWFWEAPFWSSSMGHHFRHSEIDCPIPHYGHLYMSRDELLKYLIDEGRSSTDSERIVNFIYDRPDLSKLSRTQTRDIISSSKFTIEKWDDDIDQHYSAALEEKVLSNNIYDIPKDDLRIKGSKVGLRMPKPPTTA
jgi:glycosyltransferase involved in cell wall biosynthesis/ubiquinone/menaquinone biosynthesis C-methylase UbiE